MEKLEDKFNELNNLVNDLNWELVQNDGLVCTEKKMFTGSDIACFRSYGYVNAKPEQLFKDIWNSYNFENMKKFDPDVVSFRILQETKQTRLCHQVNKLTWPLWSRDSVYFQSYRCIDQTYLIVMYSVESTDVPKDDTQYVRALINISGYVFIPENNKTKIYRIAHIDPAGSIPVSIVNSYATKTTTMIRELQKKYA